MSRLSGRLRTTGKWGAKSAKNRKHEKGKEGDGKMTGDGGRNTKEEIKNMKNEKSKGNENGGKTVGRVRERATREE